MTQKITMDKIVALCKNRGFIFPGSEIYGGLANAWDYGPLGAELLNNVKRAWWQKFVQESPYNVGMDAAILMNPETWVASGHVVNFNDPLMDCKACKARFRADKLIEDYAAENSIEDIHPDGWSNEAMYEYIVEHGIECPECGKTDFTTIRKFNMMFKTFQGVNEDTASEIYLRPETCQGIFVNFKNVQRSMRKKIPFGIAQIGKSFRNEITPGNFTFRTREFEQMELEFFCEPGTDIEWYNFWKEYCKKFLLSLGMKEDNMRLREHSKDELCHYSNGTTDIEYLFPFGWGELCDGRRVVKVTTLKSFLPSKGYWGYGDNDERVACLAKFMYTTFPKYSPRSVLGSWYGPKLKASITEFQNRTGLYPDGCVGRITYAKLKEYGFKY